MDCKDLMIGDWCAYGVNCKGRVTALTDHLITLSVDGNEINGLYMLMPDMIRPIPLTEEILAKNEFVKTWNGDWQFKEYSTIIISKDYYVNIFERSIRVDYVHELQHLLRLCGIEKELTI